MNSITPVEYYLVNISQGGKSVSLFIPEREPMTDQQEKLHSSLDGEPISLNKVIFRIMDNLQTAVPLKKMSLSPAIVNSLYILREVWYL